MYARLSRGDTQRCSTAPCISYSVTVIMITQYSHITKSRHSGFDFALHSSFPFLFFFFFSRSSHTLLELDSVHKKSDADMYVTSQKKFKQSWPWQQRTNIFLQFTVLTPNFTINLATNLAVNLIIFILPPILLDITTISRIDKAHEKKKWAPYFVRQHLSQDLAIRPRM